MTLAVGAICREGAVIATDTLLWERDRLEGSPWRWRRARKVWPLPRWSGVYACYGAWAEPSVRDSFTGTVFSVQNRIMSIAGQLIDYEHGHNAGTLAVGMDGGTQRMVMWSGNEYRASADRGAVFQLGYAADIKLPNPMESLSGAAVAGFVPANLETCLALVEFIARATVSQEYARFGKASLDECLAAGVVPGVGLPIDLAILRPYREMEIKTICQ